MLFIAFNLVLSLVSYTVCSAMVQNPFCATFNMHQYHQKDYQLAYAHVKTRQSHLKTLQDKNKRLLLLIFTTILVEWLFLTVLNTMKVFLPPVPSYKNENWWHSSILWNPGTSEWMLLADPQRFILLFWCQMCKILGAKMLKFEYS